MHLIELPELEAHAADEDPALVRWARFLRAESERELDSLAEEDPIMAQAKEALELLSRDPSAEALAESRHKGRVYLQLELGAAEARGRSDGESTALRDSVAVIAELLSIEMSGERRDELASAELPRLRAILAHLRTERRWPS